MGSIRATRAASSKFDKKEVKKGVWDLVISAVVSS